MNKTISKNNRSSFFLKVIMPSIVAVMLFILSFYVFIIPTFENTIMDRKREMIRELTNSVWSVLLKYEKEETDSLSTRQSAQQKAISEIRQIHYGDEMKDYFWITDMQPNMIMHPYRIDLDGKPLNDFKDAHGKHMFVEFVNVVKKDKQGYVDYMWQWKDDSLRIVPKLSFVKLFEPWGWIIGTGIYIEDVKKEIKALTQKLLWISVSISILIIFLLFIISQQSLKIERKRIAAENELHESKEKYRTLVEAATEGLIMLINGKISFSNNFITKITGFDSSELNNISLSEIISENNSQDIISLFSKKIIREGNYDLNLKKKGGGFVEVILTASTPVFAKEVVNIVTIKDITINRTSNLSLVDYQKLINILNIGFFRARIDIKGKFIFANETTIRLLGYSNFRELSETHILDMLSDSEDKKNLRNILLENGFVKNKILKIYRKNNEMAMVAVTLVVLSEINSKELICDGVIEDITIKEKEKSETNILIAQLNANNYLIEQPVTDYIIPCLTLDADKTINDAIKLLSVKKTESLIVTKNNNEYIGIVTGSDIQKRVLEFGLKLDNPIYLIMSSPVFTVKESISVADAINFCEAKEIHHLLVKNETGQLAGMLLVNDLYKSFKNALVFHIAQVNKALTVAELAENYQLLQLHIKSLIQSEMSAKHITKITSTFSDTVTRRIIELTIHEIGEPPVGFSFICLGSEGRKEETLLTDQDNALIYEDVSKEQESKVNEYFLKLGEKVCDSLNQVGYSFCLGNIMAKNAKWCKPYSIWEAYFTDWITSPEPQNLLDATIFFDFRTIYGDETITEKLRKTLDYLVSKNSLFAYHLAYNTYFTKLPQVSSGSIISDRSADSIDLKSAMGLIVMFVRTYCLQHNIWDTNTLERINALEAKQFIHESTATELIFIYNYLMKLRLRIQVELMVSRLPLSNILNTKTLVEIEMSVLKKVLSLLPVFQNKIGVDFRIKV